MAEINDSYIKSIFGDDLPPANIDKLKNAMQKYGDNFWWESKDPVQVAMYQIFEDILMVDFSTYHEGLETIVGRPVYTHEFGLTVEGLRKEAQLGLKRLKKGIGTSDEYKETMVRRSIEALEDYCKKTGKQFLVIEPDASDGMDRSGHDGFLQ